MTGRSFALFIHVLSAMGLFGAIALEGAMLARHRLERETRGTDAVDARLAGRLGGISMLALVASGGYLMATVWGWRAAWLDVALLTIVATVAIGIGTERLARAELRLASFALRSTLFAGIVFLMTVKPPLTDALVAVTIAATLGVAAALGLYRSGLAGAMGDHGGSPFAPAGRHTPL
jgi:hypothetical protein